MCEGAAEVRECTNGSVVKVFRIGWQIPRTRGDLHVLVSAGHLAGARRRCHREDIHCERLLGRVRGGMKAREGEKGTLSENDSTLAPSFDGLNCPTERSVLECVCDEAGVQIFGR